MCGFRSQNNIYPGGGRWGGCEWKRAQGDIWGASKILNSWSGHDLCVCSLCEN